jgi:hypothetical protein
VKKLLIAIVITSATLSLSGCDVFYPHSSQSPTPSDSASPSETPSVDPSESPSATPTQTSIAREKVTVRILQSSTDAGAGTISVVAEVADISEDGGSCTLIVTQGSVTRQITAKAESNVTDTQCYPLNIPTTGFTSGSAQFEVKYDSTYYLGSSSGNAITIP